MPASTSVLLRTGTVPSHRCPPAVGHRFAGRRHRTSELGGIKKGFPEEVIDIWTEI